MSFFLFTKTLKCLKIKNKIVYKRKINYMRYILGKQNHKRSHISHIIINTKTIKKQKLFLKEQTKSYINAKKN